MAGIDEIFSALKNINSALSTLALTWLKTQGIITTATVTAQTLVVTGPGRLVSFAVTVAGAAGTINNAAATANAAAANALCATPAVVGVTQVGAIFTNGLVISPGAGQSLNVTYYIGA